MAEESRLKGVRVLVIEDDGLSASLAQETLVELGCCVAGVATSVEGALAALENSGQLDCVMLDVRLGAELSSGIAAQLLKKELPFVVCSGYGIKLPGMSIPVVDKPYTLETLGKALGQALAAKD